MLNEQDRDLLAGAMADLAARPSGRLHLITRQFGEVDSGFDVSEPFLINSSDTSFDYEAGWIATIGESISTVSATGVELRVFLSDSAVYGRLITDREHGFAGRQSRRRRERGEPEPPPADERWGREPTTAEMIANIRATADAMRDLSAFAALLASPTLEAGELEPEATAPELRRFELSGPLTAFGDVSLPGFASSGDARPETVCRARLCLDRRDGRLTRVETRYEHPMPSVGLVESSLSIYGGEHLRPLERPSPEECLPDLPPLAGFVSDIALIHRSYTLRFAHDGQLFESFVIWRPDLLYPYLEPLPGEHLWVSGAYFVADPETLVGRAAEPDERTSDHFICGSVMNDRGYLFDHLEGRNAPTPAQIEKGEEDEAYERDEHGLSLYWEGTEVFETILDEVEQVPDGYQLSLRAADGQTFSGFGGQYYAEALAALNVAVGDPVTIYRGWTEGEAQLRWAENPSGTVVFGAKPI